MGREETKLPEATGPEASFRSPVRAEARPSVSGSYSVVEAEADAPLTLPPASQDGRVSWTQPISARSDLGLAELTRLPLSALTVTADRRLVSANPSAERLLELNLGLELDDGHVRCTDPTFAARFAKLVAAAAAAAQRGRQLHEALELRRPDASGWLDVVVAAHPEGNARALIVVRART